VARDYADRIGFVGIAGLGTEAAMAEFVESYGVGGFEHAVDGDGSLWAHLGVPLQPAWVFIDSTGEAERVV
jgi:hypothetical protein